MTNKPLRHATNFKVYDKRRTAQIIEAAFREDGMDCDNPLTADQRAAHDAAENDRNAARVGISLTKGQQVAFEGIMEFLRGDTESSMAVLEGYAGTGKTTLVGMALAQLHDMAIAVAAPTNKAVRVLRDKLSEAGAPVSDDPSEPGGKHKASVGAIAFGSIHAFLG